MTRISGISVNLLTLKWFLGFTCMDLFSKSLVHEASWSW